jgi:hypothetical protein
MPLLFIGLGIVFILTGLKGDAGSLWELVKGDFTGQNNYVYWMLSILALGALGYVESLQKLSRLFIILIVIVLLLDNNGFFAHFQQFINSNSQASSGSKSQ